MEAAKLRAGDILVTCNGEYVVVEQVQHELLEAPITVYNFEVEDFYTYYVAANEDAEFVLVHNRCGDEKAIYNSAKDSPDYRSDFIKVQNGTKHFNIKNKPLLSELNQHGKGWVKVYSDGYIGNAKMSMHYFTNKAGKVFNLKYKNGWSVLE